MRRCRPTISATVAGALLAGVLLATPGTAVIDLVHVLVSEPTPDGKGWPKETPHYDAFVLRRPGAEARSRARGFTAGVAATDHDDVERFGRGNHARLLSRSGKSRKQ